MTWRMKPSADASGTPPGPERGLGRVDHLARMRAGRGSGTGSGSSAPSSTRPARRRPRGARRGAGPRRRSARGGGGRRPGRWPRCRRAGRRRRAGSAARCRPSPRGRGRRADRPRARGQPRPSFGRRLPVLGVEVPATADGVGRRPSARRAGGAASGRSPPSAATAARPSTGRSRPRRRGTARWARRRRPRRRASAGRPTTSGSWRRRRRAGARGGGRPGRRRSVGATRRSTSKPSAAQLGGEAPHRGQHQVQALAVPRLRRRLRRALDHQHPDLAGPTVGERADVAAELVAEHPDRVHAGTVRRPSAGTGRGRLLPMADGTTPSSLAPVDRARRAARGPSAAGPPSPTPRSSCSARATSAPPPSQVADRAGISERLIYHHFTDLEELFQVVATRQVAAVAGAHPRRRSPTDRSTSGCGRSSTPGPT